MGAEPRCEGKVILFNGMASLLLKFTLYPENFPKNEINVITCGIDLCGCDKVNNKSLANRLALKS